MVARQGDPFGEIMIVNPSSYKGERRMKLYPINKSALYGYIVEEPEALGYFAEEPYEMGYMPEDIAYVADPPPGFTEGFGYAPTEVAYVAEEPEFVKTSAMGYAHDIPETVGYFAEEPYEMGEEESEMGYFAEEPDEMGEDESEVGYFAEGPDDIEGYVRETREPAFSPRVVPADKISGIEGYIRPKMINPTCESILPAEVVSKPASDWFKPLW